MTRASSVANLLTMPPRPSFDALVKAMNADKDFIVPDNNPNLPANFVCCIGSPSVGSIDINRSMLACVGRICNRSADKLIKDFEVCGCNQKSSYRPTNLRCTQVKGLEDVKFKPHCCFGMAAAAPIPSAFFEDVEPGLERTAYETLTRLVLAYRFANVSVADHLPATANATHTHWVEHAKELINSLGVQQITHDMPLANVGIMITACIIGHAGTDGIPAILAKLIDDAMDLLGSGYYAVQSLSLPSYRRCATCVSNPETGAPKFCGCLRFSDSNVCLACLGRKFDGKKCGLSATASRESSSDVEVVETPVSMGSSSIHRYMTHSRAISDSQEGLEVNAASN